MTTTILIMLIKSPDDEDGEPKSDASTQRLEMGTSTSAKLELLSFKSKLSLKLSHTADV